MRRARLPSVVALLVAVALAHSVPAPAAEITADGLDCTLAEAIDSANADSAGGSGCADGSGTDVILLGADVVLATADPGSTNTQGGAAGLPDVTSTITLRAGAGDTVERDASLGCVIEDPTAFRLLNVGAGVGADAALTLEGVTLGNGCIAPPAGMAGSGGAVLVEGGASLTIQGGAFIGNRTRGGRAGAGTAASGRGGAVAVLSGGVLTIDGTAFSNNGARGGRGNSSTGSAEGGAVYVEDGAASISHADFEDNSAIGGSCLGNFPGGAGYGGALRLLRVADFDVVDSQLANNLAEGGASDGFAGGGFGGAIAIDVADDGTLERLKLIGNIAQGGASAVDTGGGGSGGALYVFGTLGPLVADSYFAANKAVALGGVGASGGGAYLIQASADMQRCTFEGNEANGEVAVPAPAASGGAVFVTGTRAATIRNSTFDGNAAQGGDHQGWATAPTDSAARSSSPPSSPSPTTRSTKTRRSAASARAAEAPRRGATSTP